MDTIHIADLELLTHIGITEEERRTEQRVRISVDLFASTRKAGTSDNIHDTIDYAAVVESIKTLGETERNTLEKFTEDIAEMVLEKYQPESVKVSVWKFILPDTKGVAVSITRP